MFIYLLFYGEKKIPLTKLMYKYNKFTNNKSYSNLIVILKH